MYLFSRFSHFVVCQFSSPLKSDRQNPNPRKLHFYLIEHVNVRHPPCIAMLNRLNLSSKSYLPFYSPSNSISCIRNIQKRYKHGRDFPRNIPPPPPPSRSEEHTSELQSHSDLVCRLL